MRSTYEFLTNFQFFMDFYRDSIKPLSKSCIKTIDRIVDYVPNGIAAKISILGTSISTISILWLVVATNAVKYYTEIGRTPNFYNMHYVNVLGEFKTD